MDERKHMTEDTTSTHLNRWKSRRHLISPDLGRVHKLCSTVQQPHCLKTCLFLYNEPQAWSRRCTCHQNPLRQNQVCVLGPESLPAFAFLKSYSETNYEPKCDQIFSCSASGFILFFHAYESMSRVRIYERMSSWNTKSALWLRKALVQGKKGQSGILSR